MNAEETNELTKELGEDLYRHDLGQKYYYIVYEVVEINKRTRFARVTDKHPIDWLIQIGLADVLLVYDIEISYSQYKKLKGKKT